MDALYVVLIATAKQMVFVPPQNMTDRSVYLAPFTPEKEMQCTVDLWILESTLATFPRAALTHLPEPEGLSALRVIWDKGHHRRSSCKAGNYAF